MTQDDTAAELLAKDQRINELVAQSDLLIGELNAAVADMRRKLAGTSGDVAERPLSGRDQAE